MPTSVSQRVQKRRDALRAAGLRPDKHLEHSLQLGVQKTTVLGEYLVFEFGLHSHIDHALP